MVGLGPQKTRPLAVHRNNIQAGRVRGGSAAGTLIILTWPDPAMSLPPVFPRFTYLPPP